jgi:hypothetical protein
MRIKYMKIALTVGIAMAAAHCASNTPLGGPLATEPNAKGGSRANAVTVHLSNEGPRAITTVTNSDVPAIDVLSSSNSNVKRRRDVLRAKLAAFLLKGPPALVLVDHPLPNDAIAEVYLNRSGPLTRFIVVPRATLDDEVIERAYSLLKNYEMENPDDQGPVTFRVDAKGDFVRTSNAGEHRDRQNFQMFFAGRRDRRSRWLLESALRVPVTEIPGIGQGRIMQLGESR